MEEIKVNDYIRTKDGIIRKYHHSDIHYGDVLIRTDKKDIIYDFEIVKHSPNIIDLIEEGDYVNGVEVVDLDDGIHLKFANNVSFVDVGISTYTDGHVEGIKSIVTKEQFNQMKYIVGE